MERLREIYLNLTERILPRRAKENGWVIVYDHCFQRVILDTVFGDCWYNYLDKQADKPAYKQMSREQLIQAIEVSKKIEQEGQRFIEELNEKSLEYRGEA